MDPKLLDILVCPVTKGPLIFDRQAQELIALESGLAYPIRDGIPVMLIEEGARWKDTPVEALPVPPPPAEEAPVVATRAGEIAAPASQQPNVALLMAIAALVVALLLLIGLSRRRATPPEALPEPLVP